MFLYLEEALQMDHSSRDNFEGDERNIMMAVPTQVEESVEADGKLDYH